MRTKAVGDKNKNHNNDNDNDDKTGSGDDETFVANVSVPVVTFIEEAFMRADMDGFEREFVLDGNEGSGDGGSVGIAAVRLRVKFHLQAGQYFCSHKL